MVITRLIKATGRWGDKEKTSPTNTKRTEARSAEHWAQFALFGVQVLGRGQRRVLSQVLKPLWDRAAPALRGR